MKRTPVVRRHERHRLRNVSCGIAAAGLGALAAYAVLIEPSRLVVRQVEVPIPGLPRPLEGFRIGQLSDLHWGPLLPRRRLERAVTLLAAKEPELVALTGDFLSYWPRYAQGYAELLAPLHPPYGTFACTGNHDHWTRVDDIVAALRSAGVTVLRNAQRTLDIKGALMSVIGVDDLGTSGFNPFRVPPTGDLTTAIASSPPGPDVFRLLLMHNPDHVFHPTFLRETAKRPIHLVLAGHTHGGQVRLPILGILYNPSRFGELFSGGLVELCHTRVHVSRGVGASWPVRFRCRPEVNILTLRGG